MMDVKHVELNRVAKDGRLVQTNTQNKKEKDIVNSIASIAALSDKL